MHRLLLTVAALLASLVPGAVGAAENQTWDRDFAVGRQPTVRIETDDAQVTVRSWKESKVKVRVSHRGPTQGFTLGIQRPRVQLQQEGNQVRVMARMESAVSVNFFSNAHLDVDVWLPRESDLIVNAEDGPVKIEDVAGKIDLRSQDGPLVADRLRGDIRVRSQDGSVRLDDVDGSLQLVTQDGESSVRGRFDRMEVESGDGGVEIEARTGSRLSEEWSVRSQDGGIRLHIPNDLAATIDARSSDGSLSFDLPLQVQGRVRENLLVGELNGGGPVLRLRTRDGSIRVMPID
ncbi:MAG TPA: DUF4097 family beta strand repeat-containing protein [Candidatus Eisenbacteria bacterium]|nr:DUF4097 family beta strand repeat-containing protein [Candidatus Eisenbacteria bacterium]